MKEYRLPAYAQCHGPESLLMIEAAIPKAAVNEVIVRVHAVSLSRAIDSQPPTSDIR